MAVWSDVVGGSFTTTLAGFAIISVDADNLVQHGQDDVVVLVQGAGTVQGKVFWGGIPQPVKAWTDTAITVGPVNASTLTDYQAYAWDVWRPI